MSVINYTAADGTTHKLPLPEGGDPATVVAEFEASQTPLSTAALPILDDPSPVAGSISEAQELRGITDPLLGTNTPTTTQDRVERGLSLGGRTVAGAIPKAATGVADLGATVLNLIPELISRGDVALGGKPLDARLPTGSSGSLDEFLNEIFPEPQGILENVAVEGGQLALSGGAGGAALANRAATTALPTASTKSLGSNILDEIGAFFAKSPKTAAVTETTGSTGAVAGGELAEKADLPPSQRGIAALVGGLLGGAAPIAGVNAGRRAVSSIAENLLPGTKTGSEIRAARQVQDTSADIPGDVARLQDRPEGVSVARATEDEGLLALESRVLADDPKLGRKVKGELAAAEERTLTDLADSFGPKTNKAAWQQEVVLQGTPKDAEIKIGQPDEMIGDAAKAFDTAYDAVKGNPIQTQKIEVDGVGLTLRQAVENALDDPDILTTPAIQERVSSRIQARLTKLEAGSGKFEEGSVALQVDSAEFISLRSAIRKKERQLAKTAATNADAAEEAALLGNVNKVLTTVLESQLPAEASAALVATDARYAQFKVVESAINRSGTAGLTPEALRAAVKASGTSAGQFARGETGELGRLAETGRDVSKVLGKPDEAARLTRNMTPEQLQTAKSDFRSVISEKSTKTIAGESRLDGKKLLDNINKQRETLKAAGFTDKELSNLERMARELKVIQAVSPDTAAVLIKDNVNTVIRFLGALVGSRAGTRALRVLGGTAGAGPSLVVAGFGSRIMQQRLKDLSVDQADNLLRQAFEGQTRTVDGKEVTLLEALLTKPTAGLAKQAEAARIMNAFLVEPASQIPQEDE